jgi:hypothetical protein
MRALEGLTSTMHASVNCQCASDRERLVAAWKIAYIRLCEEGVTVVSAHKTQKRVKFDTHSLLCVDAYVVEE